MTWLAHMKATRKSVTKHINSSRIPPYVKAPPTDLPLLIPLFFFFYLNRPNICPLFVCHPLAAAVLTKAAEIGSRFERIEQLMKIRLVALEATIFFINIPPAYPPAYAIQPNIKGLPVVLPPTQ